MRRHAIALLAVAVLMMLASCATVPSVDVPTGFAAYRDTTPPKAVSPEGVGFRLRQVDNEPPQSLEFWAAALGRYMGDAGYVLVDQERFVAVAGSGIAFEWTAPVGEEDWIYLVAVVVAGDRILIAEAAGSVDRYRAHREEVREALTTIAADRARPGE
jgi:hypothetical protein